MIDKNKELSVKNRSSIKVIYSIPNLGISHKEIMPGQTIKCTYNELENLSYQPGGRTLMSEYLLITDPEAPNFKNDTVEPEYYYEDEEVINLLKNGSLDEFLDALDFAPDGVIDLIKKYSLELPLNDVAKRQALIDKQNFNVAAIIENSKPDEDEVPEEKPTGRRVKKEEETTTSTTSKRRVKKA